MALTDRETMPRTTSGDSHPRLDAIWGALTADDRDTFRRWFTTKTAHGKWLYSSEWIAQALTAEGHPISSSWVTAARRRGWEPSA